MVGQGAPYEMALDPRFTRDLRYAPPAKRLPNVFPRFRRHAKRLARHFQRHRWRKKRQRSRFPDCPRTRKVPCLPLFVPATAPKAPMPARIPSTPTLSSLVDEPSRPYAGTFFASATRKSATRCRTSVTGATRSGARRPSCVCGSARTAEAANDLVTRAAHKRAVSHCYE